MALRPHVNGVFGNGKRFSKTFSRVTFLKTPFSCLRVDGRKRRFSKMMSDFVCMDDYPSLLGLISSLIAFIVLHVTMLSIYGVYLFSIIVLKRLLKYKACRTTQILGKFRTNECLVGLICSETVVPVQKSSRRQHIFFSICL